MKPFSVYPLLIAIVVLAILFSGGKDQQGAPELTGQAQTQWQATYQRIQSASRNQDWDQAAPLLDTMLAATDTLPKDVQYWLWVQQAKVKQSRMHWHHGIRALEQAYQLNPKSHLRDRIHRLQQHIDSNQTERHQHKRYRSGKGQGMSHDLRWHIQIAYLYIDDNKFSRWSGQQRLQNQARFETVVDWYQQQAKAYGIDNLSFRVRYFVLRSPRGLARAWLREPSFFPYIMEQTLKQLGHRSLQQFTDSLKQSDSDQVALVFHSNSSARSYAQICLSGYRCDHEYVMLTEAIGKGQTEWALPQVQAHEILHLFGAADLYNITGAKNYAVTDIMNYYSKDLKYASIDPITAWAIGWAEQPKAPFRID